MKKAGILSLALLIILSVFGGCKSTSPSADKDGKLSVYTSFYTMYDFAKKIGGTKANIVNLVPAGTEPHDWEPSASDIARLESADLFIYNGAGLEHWVDTVNHSLNNKKLVTVEAAKGITLMQGHEEEASDGHEDNQNSLDPHVWLSPVNAKKELENIKNAFVQADPDNKDYYQSNYNQYAKEFDRLDQEYKDTLTVLPNKNIIVAHEAFGYLCKTYGLNQVAIEGVSADSEPDPARMAEIIKFAKKNDVKVIFFEELVSPKVAKTIAKTLGAKTAVLNPLEGLTDAQEKAGNDYFSVMRENLKTLKSSLEY